MKKAFADFVQSTHAVAKKPLEHSHLTTAPINQEVRCEGRDTVLMVQLMQLPSSSQMHLSNTRLSLQLSVAYFMREPCMNKHT